MTVPVQQSLWKEWLPAISAAVLILGAIMSAGSAITRISDGERRIGLLEQDLRESETKYQQILERLSRIEGKLDAPAGERSRHD